MATSPIKLHEHDMAVLIKMMREVASALSRLGEVEASGRLFSLLDDLITVKLGEKISMVRSDSTEGGEEK